MTDLPPELLQDIAARKADAETTRVLLRRSVRPGARAHDSDSDTEDFTSTRVRLREVSVESTMSSKVATIRARAGVAEHAGPWDDRVPDQAASWEDINSFVVLCREDLVFDALALYADQNRIFREPAGGGEVHRDLYLKIGGVTVDWRSCDSKDDNLRDLISIMCRNKLPGV